jgi:hypothetical protein
MDGKREKTFYKKKKKKKKKKTKHYYIYFYLNKYLKKKKKKKGQLDYVLNDCLSCLMNCLPMKRDEPYKQTFHIF